MSKNSAIFFLLLFGAGLPVILQAQSKKQLDHSVYEIWKRIEQPQISKDGNLLVFEVNPLRKDGNLSIYIKKDDKTLFVPKGKGAKITPKSELVVFSIKPGYDTLKSANLKKVKKDDLPKDSLGIYITSKDSLIKFADIKSFKLPEESEGWLAIHFDKLKKPKEEKKAKDSSSVKDTSLFKDTSKIAKEKEPKPSKGKKEGTDLLLFNPLKNLEFRFSNVDDYTTDKSGSRFAFISMVNDSVDTAYVVRFNTQTLKGDTIVLNGSVKSSVLSDDGKRLAFLFSPDTATVKNYNLYLLNDKDNRFSVLIDSVNAAIPAGYRVSANYDLNFSDFGERLFFGIAKALQVEPDETLLDEEKPNVEVWGWNDPLIYTQQNFELSREKKKTFLFVWHLDKGKAIQLTDSLLESVSFSKYFDNKYALGTSGVPYKKLISWDDGYSDLYSVDITSGERKLIKKKQSQLNTISPNGKFIVWYEESDSSYYSYDNESGTTAKISNGISEPLFDVENDVPDQPSAYGTGGWTEDDKNLLIHSRYDVWMVDPRGDDKPVRLTSGKESNIVFRTLDLDRELPFFHENSTLYFTAFNKTSKESGFAKFQLKSDKTAQILFITANGYGAIAKAKNSDDFLINRESSKESPNIYYSKGLSPDLKRISDINPQHQDWLWADVQLVKYYSIDGKPLEGLLYLPENLDKSKKYPMMVYFYEKSSDNLNRYWTPSPSRSIINPSFYASNQYVVFIPDIVYEEGYPGKGAYNCIVGGTLSMLEQFPFIDRENIALQGQSWGGYQTAFLITQTNLYKAAMAGAPVSNMTSAYGGIRWGSGLVRQFQYEKGQSRIGASLWEKPELYIANSPLFFLDRVQTPLLIWANDKDDAVPWYQGIELYAGLRRLEKPVWMLNYTGDVHNLKESNWGNRVDLSIRMLQFFDHYLKGAPAPKWMTEGIRAIDKDKIRGY